MEAADHRPRRPGHRPRRAGHRVARPAASTAWTPWSRVRAFYLDIAQWAVDDPARWAPWAAPCPIRDERDRSAQEGTLAAASPGWTSGPGNGCPSCPSWPPPSTQHAHRLPQTGSAAAGRRRPGEQFTAGGQTLRRPVMTRHGTSAQVWAEDPGHRQAPRPDPRRAPRVLGLGRGGGPAPHRHPHRGAHRTVAPQPHPIPAARHRRARPAAADRPVQDRHRAAAGHQPRAGRRPQRDHQPDPRRRRRRARWSSPTTSTNGSGTRRCRCCSSAASASSTGPSPPSAIRDLLEHRPGRHRAHRRRRRTRCSSPPTTSAGSSSPTPIMHGMPPHIAQLVAGHRDINTTMGYKAVYPEEVINGHRAFIARRRATRPSEEYRTPTDDEWDEFLGHFERRKVALGDCGRAYGTSCIHEHSCIRCPLLRLDPAQRPRLDRDPRQPDRPHRRSRTRRLARRSRGTQDQPRRRRGTSSPRSTSSPAAPPPCTSACPA